MTRTRTRTVGPEYGGYYERFWSQDLRTFNSETSTCIDSPGAGSGMPFQVYKESVTGGRIQSYGTQSPYLPWWQDCICDAVRFGSLYGHLSIPDAPGDIGAATLGAERSNPSKPVVDLSVAAAELRELPSLFKLSGDNIVSLSGSTYLATAFGWAPLVSDFIKLCQINRQIARRAARLERMSRRGAEEVDVTVFSDSAEESGTLAVEGGITSPYSKKTTYEVSYFGRWQPDPGGLPLSHEDSLRLAEKAVLGLTIDPLTAWNLMPWSWLFDYAFNVSNYLGSKRNVVGMSLGDESFVKRRISTLATTPSADWGGHYFNGIFARTDTKYRAPASPSVEGQLPFLSGGQASIIGSLYASRYGFLYGKRASLMNRG